MATQRLGKINIGFTVPQNQLQLYNALGRTTGADAAQGVQQNQGGGDNFFAKRGRSIENAIGTTLVAPIEAIRSGSGIFKGTENIATENLLKDTKKSMNDIAKKYGYNSWSDWQDAYYAAKNAGNTTKVAEMEPQLKEFQAQANINAAKADKKAADFKDYRENNYISKKVNQDNTKFLGSAINTLSTAADLTGITATPGWNAVQGAAEGFADEMEQNGGNIDLTRPFSQGIKITGGDNFSWERAGQNALIGATTGAVTGALNKGISGSLAKRAAAKGLTNTATKAGIGSALKNGAKTIATGAARGALSGAVGGATGAGLQSAIESVRNGADFGQGVQNALQSAAQGAVQGAQQGAVTGGIMAGANAAARKVPGVGNVLTQIDEANKDWATRKANGESFNERLTNTLASGDSAVGDWLMNKRQSKVLGAAGNLGNGIRFINDEFELESIPGMSKNLQKYLDNMPRTPEYMEKEIEHARQYVDEYNNAADKSKTNFGYLSESPDGAKMVEAMRELAANGDTIMAEIGGNTQQTPTTAGKTIYHGTPNQFDEFDEGLPSVWFSDSDKNLRDTGLSMPDGSKMNVMQRQLPNNIMLADEGLADKLTKQQLMDRGYAGVAYTERGPNGDETYYEIFNPNQTLNKLSDNSSNQTPTTAKGWAKKAGQRIVEDINNSNLGNRVKDVSSDMPEDIRNMQVRDYNANADGELTPSRFSREAFEAGDGSRNELIKAINRYNSSTPEEADRIMNLSNDGSTITMVGNKKKVPVEQMLGTLGMGNGEVDTTYGIASDPRVRQQLLANVNAQLAENPNARIGDTNFDADAIISEYSDRLTPEQYRNFNPTDAENALVQELQSLEASQGFTRPNSRQITQTTQIDPWDRVAQEAGYSNYDEVLQRYAEANPNAKINPRGMAGQVLTWMDQNPNTPTTASGWAKRAGQRAVEDINNSNLGLKVRDVSQDDPSKQLYNALAGNRQPVAETEVETEADMGTIPSKTSKESKLRYARGKELVAQYGTVDAPMARATNAVKTFQRISDMGFEDPTDVEFMANAITGSNGYVSTLNRNIIKSAKPVDTFTGDGGQTLDEFIDNSIAVNKLSGLNEGVAVKRSIDAYLKSLPSRAEGSVDYKDSAADTFKVVQGLEASAAELEGRGGSTYHRADTVDLHQAAVLKDVANLLKNRIYDGSNAKIAITPQVVKEMKALAPDNEKWSTTVDDFAKNVKTPQDLRRFQEPFVKAGRYIDNQYVQAATVGGRMAANAGELPSTLRTTKAGIINDLVNRAWNSNMAHRGRAALYGKLADRAAEKAANNPTTAKGWAKQAGQRAAEDLGNTNLGNRIQNVSGQPVNPQVASPAELANTVANYNPSTQLYNAIGRTEGALAQEAPAQYLANAAQEAEIVSPMEAPTAPTNDIATSMGNPSTATYDALAGTPTTAQQATTGSINTGYFQPTGDYWTDIIASAMSAAIDTNDAESFATLLGMYQNQMANLQKQASAAQSSSQQKLTSTQQRANAAMNSLERLSEMEPDTAYNLSSIPLIGNIATFGGNDYEAEAKSLAQQIGYMVSGSNIKDTEAENIGKSYVPQPWDNEQVRQNKLRRAYEIIQRYQNGYAEE